MYCIKCGAKIEEGQKFCNACGEKADYANEIENNIINKDGVFSEENAVDFATAKSVSEEIGNASSEDKTILEQYQEATNYNVKKERPARKKLLILACLVLVAALVVGATIYSGYAQQKKQKEEYLLEAATFRIIACEYASKIGGLGETIHEYWMQFYKTRGFWGNIGTFIDGEPCYTEVDAIELAIRNNASEEQKNSLEKLKEYYKEFEELAIPEGKTAEEAQQWEEVHEKTKAVLAYYETLYRTIFEPGCAVGDYLDNIYWAKIWFNETVDAASDACDEAEALMN